MARAQTPPPERSADWPLRIEGCSAELASALPSVVRLEVDVLLRERGPASPPDNVAVHCDGDSAQIELSLHGATRDTNVDLSQLAPQHRARALALATAELLHSLANRDEPSSPPAPSRPPPSSSSSSSSSSSPPPRRASPPAALLVGGLAEWLGAPATPLFGARIALQYPLSSLVVPALSADASFGSASSASARVAAKTLSVATHLYFQTTTHQLRFAIGPGARVGWAQLVGQPSSESMLEGRTLSGAWGGPEARARIAYATSAARSPLLALELGVGVVTLPVRGLRDGAEPVYAVTGPWLSLCIELGMDL